MKNVPLKKEQGFRPPAEGESLSLACPRESNQREGHPAYALSEHPCPESTRAGCGVCRQSIHGLTPNWFASLRTTLRALLHPPAATEGARVERRASCAHFSEKPDQKKWSNSKTTAEQRFVLVLLLLLLPLLHFLALHRVRATMARCSTGAPVRR